MYNKLYCIIVSGRCYVFAWIDCRLKNSYIIKKDFFFNDMGHIQLGRENGILHFGIGTV